MTSITSVIALLLCSAAVISSFKVLRGGEQPAMEDLKIANTQKLMRNAALSGEKITIMMRDKNQTAIVQHHVHIIMDCSPLINSGGKLLAPVTWTRRSYLEDSSGTLSPEGLEITIYPNTRRTERLKSEGKLNEILNITRSNVIQGAERKDDGLYTCTACTASGCQSASVMLFLIGGAPRMNVAEDNEPPEIDEHSFVDKRYHIGADFCVNRSSDEIIELTCDVLGENLTSHTSIAYPCPARRWYKDDVLLYEVDIVGMSVYRGINQAFFNGQNGILRYGLVEPSPLFLLNTGELLLVFEASELAFPEFAPEGTTNVTVADDVFDALTGRWRCEVENVVGEWTAESLITECP